MRAQEVWNIIMQWDELEDVFRGILLMKVTGAACTAQRWVLEFSSSVTGEVWGSKRPEQLQIQSEMPIHPKMLSKRSKSIKLPAETSYVFKF